MSIEKIKLISDYQLHKVFIPSRKISSNDLKDCSNQALECSMKDPFSQPGMVNGKSRYLLQWHVKNQ